MYAAPSPCGPSHLRFLTCALRLRQYGDKEPWYKKLVPSGMLPALQLDGRVITESDVVLHSLEQAFGPLGAPMAKITPQRQLERDLFRAWCSVRAAMMVNLY